MIKRFCDICGNEIAEHLDYVTQGVNIGFACYPIELGIDAKGKPMHRCYEFKDVCNECKKELAIKIEEMLVGNDK